jgi:hypothetical protein
MSVATEHNIDPSNLKLWMRFYEQYGEAGIFSTI